VTEDESPKPETDEETAVDGEDEASAAAEAAEELPEIPEGEGLKGLVAYLARSLVDAPDEVEVQEFGNDERCVIKLKVVQDDLGKVIGKKGRTAKAMRTVLAAAGLKASVKTTLEIVE
jgi:hypothetical protein